MRWPQPGRGAIVSGLLIKCHMLSSQAKSFTSFSIALNQYAPGRADGDGQMEESCTMSEACVLKCRMALSAHCGSSVAFTPLPFNHLY